MLLTVNHGGCVWWEWVKGCSGKTSKEFPSGDFQISQIKIEKQKRDIEICSSSERWKRKKKKKASVGVGERTRERRLTTMKHVEQSARVWMYVMWLSVISQQSSDYFNKYTDRIVRFEKWKKKISQTPWCYRKVRILAVRDIVTRNVLFVYSKRTKTPNSVGWSVALALPANECVLMLMCRWFSQCKILALLSSFARKSTTMLIKFSLCYPVGPACPYSSLINIEKVFLTDAWSHPDGNSFCT